MSYVHFTNGFRLIKPEDILSGRAYETLCMKDFKEYLRENKEHYGIIIATRQNEYITLKRLLKILDNISADEMKNQLRYI